MNIHQKNIRLFGLFAAVLLAVPPLAISCPSTGYHTNDDEENPMEAGDLIIHPVPQEIRGTHANSDFTVSVRTYEGEWQDLFAYKVEVDLHNPRDASMVQFDFSGSVELRVKSNKGRMSNAIIRPLAKGIRPTIKDDTLSFFLSRPSKLSVEIDGDRFHNLHVFANPLETEIPGPDDPDVMYFGPGVHVGPLTNADGKKYFNIPSNKTVYLAGGAVLQGKFLCQNVQNVRFIGRGIIDNAQHGFQIDHSTNVEINGITVINHVHYGVWGGQTNKLTIRNFKSFSSKQWSDGIDVMSCSDVTIDDVFVRSSDDSIAIYGHRWGYYGDAKNYSVTNAILWADVAHPINIGLHGNTANAGEYIENLRFSNIDILDHDERLPYYQGCMAFSVGDHNLVRDVVFENIRIEEISDGKLLNMAVLFTPTWHTGPGRGIENVTFRNIFCDYSGDPPNTSVIEGYDDDRMIKDVVFENIVINGKRIQSFEEGDIRVGEFTKDITLN
jgi:hypothetical protein